jgi:hypothetical protein
MIVADLPLGCDLTEVCRKCVLDGLSPDDSLEVCFFTTTPDGVVRAAGATMLVPRIGALAALESLPDGGFRRSGKRWGRQ